MPDDVLNQNDVQKPKGKLPLTTILVVLGVLVLEGGAISTFFIMRGGKPGAAEATNPIEQTRESQNKGLIEVSVVDSFQVDNHKLGGKSKLVVTLDLVIKVEKVNEEMLQDLIKDHKSEILNAVRVVISSAQPEQIKDDPQLEIIKRELKANIEKIIPEGLITEILLPRWTSFVND